MKILYVSTDFNRSGAALAMIELSENIKKLGNDVVLVFPGTGDAVEEAKIRGLDYRIIRSYEWVKPKNEKESLSIKIKWILKHIYNIISIIRLGYLIRKENIDIVHVNTTWGYVGACAAKITNRPLIWHLREMLGEQGMTIRWEKFAKVLFNSAKALVAISEQVKNYYSTIINDKIRLIYDGIDVDRTFHGNHPIFTKEIARIVTVGGVREHKRQKDIVKAIEIINADGPKAHLSIVGDDQTKYAEEIKAYIKKNNIDSMISFEGETSDVNSWWENSDIAITASQFEAFGRVTAEAMLAGCLVIASNSGATPEIIKNSRNGYLYTLGNVKELAEIIAKTLNNPQTASSLVEKGRETITSKFDSRINAEQILQLYKEFV